MTLSSAWKISDQANRFFLSQIQADWLDDRYSARARTIREQFMHIHSVRLMWLKASAPEFMDGLSRFEKGDTPDFNALVEALEASCAAIGKLLDNSVEKGKVKNWKGEPASFFAYLVAHEAYHRGLASAALRVSGHKLDQSAVFGQWEWGKFS